MKPYPQKDLTEFLIIVCRVPDEFPRTLLVLSPIAGECCENLFHCNHKRQKIISFAILISHNWLRSESSSGRIYVPPNLIGVEGPFK